MPSGWTDQLSAPRIITRQSDEAVMWRWDTAEAFGVTAPDQNPGGLGIFSFNQRLPGQVFDAESGLFQNWNREYNPRIGRYMQSDPIGLQGGINTFAYVGGDPLNNIDSDGLQSPSRAPAPTVTYSQGLLNFQARTLIRQIREYQPNFSYQTISTPGAGFNAGNIRELQGTFQRAQQSQTCPVRSVIAETVTGRGNITSQNPLTADQLLRAGETFLGRGYNEIGKPGSGVFRSSDGTRQFRIDSNSIQGNHAPGVPHGHLEIYAPGAVRPTTNNHIPFSE